MPRSHDTGKGSTLPSRIKSKLGRRILQIRLRKKEDDLEIGTRHFPHQEFDVGDIDELIGDIDDDGMITTMAESSLVLLLVVVAAGLVAPPSLVVVVVSTRGIELL